MILLLPFAFFATLIGFCIFICWYINERAYVKRICKDLQSSSERRSRILNENLEYMKELKIKEERIKELEIKYNVLLSSNTAMKDFLHNLEEIMNLHEVGKMI